MEDSELILISSILMRTRFLDWEQDYSDKEHINWLLIVDCWKMECMPFSKCITYLH